MAKGTITFDLPEEEGEYRMAMDAHKMYSVLYDICEDLRNEVKYGDHKNMELCIWENVRDKIREIFNDYSFNLDNYQ